MASDEIVFQVDKAGCAAEVFVNDTSAGQWIQKALSNEYKRSIFIGEK